MRITPPKIPALPASLVPNFLPIKIPAKQMKNVTIAIIKTAKSARANE